ncbi:hypothetical protein [Scytonema sp. PRP1]|uniref:hypothetical protein n=1 Tax=Scytonema sp. PRP1 TaxID=3120513 RepID=UPI002FD6E24A
MLACGLVEADFSRMKQEVNEAQSRYFQLWVALGRCYVTVNSVGDRHQPARNCHYYQRSQPYSTTSSSSSILARCNMAPATSQNVQAQQAPAATPTQN